MKFTIVTPCYNPGHYLLETLQSVIEQAGDFSIHYHVQDAQSTDGTVEILNSLADQISKGDMPIQCRGVSFSYTSERDNGMYDAINRGFQTLLRDVRPDVMLWINADDRLAENAIFSIKNYFNFSRKVDWVIGRTVHLDENSKVILDLPPSNYRIEDLAAGRHDGISLPFVTQEATAWRYQAFEKAGWLDGRFQYIGDYLYWKKLAHSGVKLHSSNLKIGHHRKRKGQLSESTCYQNELKVAANGF